MIGGVKHMGFFKKKIVKEIYDGMWGHMVNEYHIDVDTLGEMRCVDRDAMNNDGLPIKLIRIFSPGEAASKGIAVNGWETFDEHPELILYEGYLTQDNKAHTVKKKESL
jgi:hypothetical protein